MNLQIPKRRKGQNDAVLDLWHDWAIVVHSLCLVCGLVDYLNSLR